MWNEDNILEMIKENIGKEVYYRDQLMVIDSLSSEENILFLKRESDKALFPIRVVNITDIKLNSEADSDVA